MSRWRGRETATVWGMVGGGNWNSRSQAAKGGARFCPGGEVGGESRGWETGGAGWGGLELPARAFINYQFHRLYLTPATERADEFT